MPSSAQRKGKEYERHIAKRLSQAFGDDVRRVPCSGALDIKGDLRGFSGYLKGVIPECKKQERIKIWKALEQTAQQAGSRIGILFFARNRSADYVVMEFGDWTELVSKAMENIEKEMKK